MIKSVNEPAGIRDVMLTPNSVNEPLSPGEIIDNLTPPMVEGVNPDSCEVGAAPFTIAVHGTDFPEHSVVTISGVPLPTTYVSAIKLTAKVDTTGVVVGEYPVTIQAGPLEAYPAVIFTVTDPAAKSGVKRAKAK
jgi:hypothetical protein